MNNMRMKKALNMMKKTFYEIQEQILKYFPETIKLATMLFTVFKKFLVISTHFKELYDVEGL